MMYNRVVSLLMTTTQELVAILTKADRHFPLRNKSKTPMFVFFLIRMSVLHHTLIHTCAIVDPNIETHNAPPLDLRNDARLLSLNKSWRRFCDRETYCSSYFRVCSQVGGNMMISMFARMLHIDLLTRGTLKRRVVFLEIVSMDLFGVGAWGTPCFLILQACTISIWAFYWSLSIE